MTVFPGGFGQQGGNPQVDPGGLGGGAVSAVNGEKDTEPIGPEAVWRLARAYLATYRGPHGDAPGADAAVTGPMDRTPEGRLVPPAYGTANRSMTHQTSADQPSTSQEKRHDGVFGRIRTASKRRW